MVQSSLSLLLLVDVDGVPTVAATRGEVVLPSHPWWLLPAMRRCTQTDVGYLRVINHKSRALGIVCSERPIPDGLAERMARECPDVEPGAEHGMVLVREGRPVSSSHPELLTQGFAQHLQSTAGLCSVWNGRHLTWTALHGRTTEHVVTLRPCRPLPEPLFASLSRAHVETCEAAVAGLTAKEIAHTRGCKVETVRSHLKVTYRRLGLCTRVELGPMVEEWKAWCVLLQRIAQPSAPAG